MTFMTFRLDQFGLPLFRADSSRYDALGYWLISDVSIHKLVCLDALAMLADVSAGRDPFEPWSSDNYTVTFTPTGVSIRSNWSDESGEYGVDEVRQAVEEFWRFLVAQPDKPHMVREYHPELPDWQASLLRWEEKWSRRHPSRGTLFD
ncbi:hypothetical protein [Actinomadura sp. 9N215]|uniref:hypothetical protein n=1 Tax=Actinomadura sp. 9N215 TaxID=3375150 RepID=UPI0037A06A2D